MTYAFPKSLDELRKYLKGHGFEGDSIKTSRQAAFVAQQLLGTRVKFPPQGQDMTLVLIEIQKAVPVKGIATMATPQRDLRHTGASTPQRYGHDDHTLRDVRDTHTPKAKRARKGNRQLPFKEKAKKSRGFAPDEFAKGIHIFCDGACEPNPGAGGWGVVVYREGVEVASQCGGDPDTTNNQMELTALLVAIEKAAQLSGNTGTMATIWCDSQYCVKGCNEWRHGWKKNGWQRGSDKAEPKNRVLANADLWKAIDEALSKIPVQNFAIRWVKGHAGVAGNERADELAEMGRQEAMELVADWPQVGDDLDECYRQIMGAA